MTAGTDDNPTSLARLREHLEAYAAIYLGEELPRQRLAVAHALMEITHYLQENGFPPDTLLMVLRPAFALAARENNALDLMFSERSRKGRPSTTSEDHMRTAILAVFADKWLKLNELEKRPIAVELKSAARQMRGDWFGHITSGKLKTAREAVSREASDHLIVEFYNSFGKFFDNAIVAVGRDRAFRTMVLYVNEHPVSGMMGILKTPGVSQ